MKRGNKNRAAASRNANLNEEHLANLASTENDLRTLSPLRTQMEGTQPQGTSSSPQNGETSSSPSWETVLARIDNIVKRLDEIDEKYRKVEKRLDEMDENYRKAEERIQEKIDDKVCEKINDLKQGLLNELNSNVTKNVQEEVLSIKTEMRVELRRDIQKVEDNQNEKNQKFQEENSDLRQSVNEQEEALYSKKIILCGNAIPEFSEGESPLNIARKVIHDNLRIRVDGRITNAIRFDPPPTDNGRPPNPKILMEVNTIGTKRHIVDTALQVRSTDLFINELLPKKTNEMFYKLRKLKKERKIAVLYTKDGVIKVRKTREGTLYKIRTKGDLDIFLQNAELR